MVLTTLASQSRSSHSSLMLVTLIRLRNDPVRMLRAAVRVSQCHPDARRRTEGRLRRIIDTSGEDVADGQKRDEARREGAARRAEDEQSALVARRAGLDHRNAKVEGLQVRPESRRQKILRASA